MLWDFGHSCMKRQLLRSSFLFNLFLRLIIYVLKIVLLVLLLGLIRDRLKIVSLLTEKQLLLKRRLPILLEDWLEDFQLMDYCKIVFLQARWGILMGFQLAVLRQQHRQGVKLFIILLMFLLKIPIQELNMALF